MYKNSSATTNNTALWHYLGIKHLDFRRENDSTQGVLIEEIRYTHLRYNLYIPLKTEHEFQMLELAFHHCLLLLVIF